MPGESYYDECFDEALITASFAQQYGIRLLQEDINAVEYRQLLIGLSGDTPLGYTVGIRSEKDSKKIKEFTKQERKIRAEWAQFRAKQAASAGHYDGSGADFFSMMKHFAKKGG
jgi:hypothetical protein